MKKILLSAGALVMLFSCQNETTEITPSADVITKRGYATQEVLAAQMKADPILELRMNEIEAFTQKAMSTARLVNGKIQIPVVVNVLYRTTSENISLHKFNLKLMY